MPGIRKSGSYPSEFDRALATVQKAETSGRQLRVGKKGNLKVVGFFGSLFLQCKLRASSKENHGRYLQGERRVIRAQVLQKLETLARQSREAAILGTFPGREVSQDVQEEIEAHLSSYIQNREETRRTLGGTERKEDLGEVFLDEITDDVFNREAVNFLQDSKRAMFVRKPVAPKCFVPGQPLRKQIDQSTGGEKIVLGKYKKSLDIYEKTAGAISGGRDVFARDYRVDSGERLHGSQARVRFFDPALDVHVDRVIEHVEKEARDHPEQSYEASKARQKRLDRAVYDISDKPPGPLSSTPDKVWNKVDFRKQAEKRVTSEVSKRQEGEHEVNEQQVVDFLCFLRKEVQKKFTGRGELPEQFQSLFNENSAVSIPDSFAEPDRLLPSKKLVRTALDLCLSRPPGGERLNVENTEVGAQQKAVTFSANVTVRETTSRARDAMVTRYAASKGQLVLDSAKQQREVFDMNDRPLPLPDSIEGLDNSLEYYEDVRGLPEGFEKFVPKDVPNSLWNESFTAGMENGDVVTQPGSDAGASDRSSEPSGVDWVNRLYAKWLKIT